MINIQVDVIVASRYKIDLIKGLHLELEQHIIHNSLKSIKNYSMEAIESELFDRYFMGLIRYLDIEIRWKATYELCAERDENNRRMTNSLDRKEISDASSRPNSRRVGRSTPRYGESPKIVSYHINEMMSSKISFQGSDVNQLLALKQWIKESVSIVEAKSDPNNLVIVCKFGLRPIQSELESLDLFLNGYVNWHRVYERVSAPLDMSSPGGHNLSESWKDLKKMVESWIFNIQNVRFFFLHIVFTF